MIAMQLLRQEPKILKMLGVQTYGQALNLLERILTIPLFVYFWGVALYGEWLVLRALPSYLSIAEIGYASAAGNKMSKALFYKKEDFCSKIFSTIFVFNAVLAIFIVSICVLLLLIFPLNDFLNFNQSTLREVTYTIFFFSLYVGCVFQTQLIASGYRAFEKAEIGAFYIYNIRLLELTVICILLPFGASIVSLSFFLFLSRFIGMFICINRIIKEHECFRIKFNKFRPKILKSMFSEAMAFFKIPVAQLISIQGVIIVISSAIGPWAVAIFSSIRTISRVLVQLSMILNRSLWPRMTDLFLSKEFNRLISLSNKCTSIYVITSLLGASLVMFIVVFLKEYITQNLVQYDNILELSLMITLSSILNGYWYLKMTILNATSNTNLISLHALLSSFVMIFFICIFNYSLETIAVTLIAQEFYMSLIANYKVKKLIGSIK